MARTDFRPDIQALRAVAVGLVVTYHLWPGRMPGGYVGVDVFFVISGFLITSHLLGEVKNRGTVSLPSFWARRIRRLLPASLTVLAASLVAALIWVPDSLLQQNLREIGASATYIVNWTLASDAVDYLASENLPSLVQHFWSLSVEEQFYLAWPVLIVAGTAGALLVARRREKQPSWAQNRVVVFVVLSAVFVASLTFSIYLTNIEQPAAYFNTFARAWEFAAGGLAASAAAAWPALKTLLPPKAAPAVGETATWVGLALIAYSALRFSDLSPFPGIIAVVPVVGAVLVLAGGGIASGRLAGRVAALWPIQRTGDLSYGIYLWHWPLIALYPFVFGTGLGTVGALVIVALSVILAGLSKYLIEDPVRTGKWWRARRWRSFALAALGAALILTITSTQSGVIDGRKAEASVRAQQQLESDAPCFGARAMAPDADCSGRELLTASTDLAFAATDLDPDWCAVDSTGDWKTCDYGDTSSPTRTIALVGDSHAAALVPAFDDYFAALGWEVVTYLRVGCPALSAAPIDMAGRTVAEQDSCATWSARVIDELVASSDIDGVVFADFSDRYYDPGVPAASRLTSATVAATWDRINASGKRVVLVRDVPNAQRTNIPACLSVSFVKSAPCAFPRSGAVLDNQVVDAVALADDARLIDMSDFFCDDDRCFAVMGDVVVYADDNHISGTYARTLAPYLGREVEDAFAG